MSKREDPRISAHVRAEDGQYSPLRSRGDGGLGWLAHLQCTLPYFVAQKGSQTLTIRAAKNPGYYEQPEFARDDYYTENDSVPGRWVGRGAERLSLHGSPERGELGTLLEARDPRTGLELQGGRGRRPTNAGFDLTFTAPKSVSVLLAVGDDSVRQKILDAQDRAVRAGLDYLERHECFARRGTNGVDVIPAEGFVGAMYTHEMARSGDPHLHTHVVIVNRVRAADGRWTAPDMRPVYAAAKTAGTIQEAVFRDELTRSLGGHWDEVRNGTADIEGVEKEVRDHFSQRHAEILEMAFARGWTTERGIEEIQRETRDRKPQIDRDVAQARWTARAAEHGFDKAALENTLDRPPRPPDVDLDALRWQLAGPKGMTMKNSTFTRRQLLQAIAGASRDGMSAPDLEVFADAFLEWDSILVSPADGHHPANYTTRDMLDTEMNLIVIACARRSPSAPSEVPGWRVEEAIANSSIPLGDDQANAVRHLTSGVARTRLLEAHAGYGKTAVIAAAAEAYRADGELVIGTAWQGETAQRMQREAGINTRTTASILQSIQMGYDPIPRGAVVFVDEASMMPTRALERLAAAVAEKDGRIILVGDREQLPSIDAGGAFASLVDRLGSAALEENRRQRDPFQRQVADLLSDGRADDALALLQEHGKLRRYDNATVARVELIDAWEESSLGHPEDALILAHDRRDVALLNLAARRRLEDAGLLGEERIDVGGREWAEGDRLICRRNEYDAAIDVRNGTRATVVHVDVKKTSLLIRTDDGRQIRLPESYLEHVDYGYAKTGHSSEGATVDRTYLLASPSRGGREWAYVAGSRHRIDLQVFALHHDMEEARAELERTWRRPRSKALAVDRLSDSSQKAFERMREAVREAEQRAEEETERARERERDRERAEHEVRRELDAQRREQEHEDDRAREQERDDLISEPDAADDIAAWIEQQRADIEAELDALDQDVELHEPDPDTQPPEPDLTIEDDQEDELSL